MTNKPDFLKECMSDPALVSGPMPLDEFNKTYCLVCANRGCTRSGSNNMSFDRRVRNWQNDLFTNVPRASDDDPNFVHIRQKMFLPVDSLIVPSGGPQFVSIQPQKSPSKFVKITKQVDEPDQTKSEPINQNQVPLEKTPEENTGHVQVDNTPFSQGMILPGGEISPKEVVIQSGGSFTFGDDE